MKIQERFFFFFFFCKNIEHLSKIQEHQFLTWKKKKKILKIVQLHLSKEDKWLLVLLKVKLFITFKWLFRPIILIRIIITIRAIRTWKKEKGFIENRHLFKEYFQRRFLVLLRFKYFHYLHMIIQTSQNMKKRIKRYWKIVQWQLFKKEKWF